MQLQPLRTTMYGGRIEGIPVLLVRPDWARSAIFKGGAIYGGSYNELEAYLYFSRCGHYESLRVESQSSIPLGQLLHIGPAKKHLQGRAHFMWVAKLSWSQPAHATTLNRM